MDDDTPRPTVKLRGSFERYAQLYPSVMPRLQAILASNDTRIRRKAQEIVRAAEAFKATRGRRLAAAFGLTPAEVRVALHLIDGGDVASCARDAKLSPGTVRSQLKSVFAKTGVNRQAELVLLGQALE
jgi:DNA-binding CsgD family transcriptional regulator